MEQIILGSHVIQFGHGKQYLVILPGISLCGLAGQGEAIAAAYAQIGEHFTCTLIDRKQSIPNMYSIRDMAEDVVDVMQALHIQSASVFAVSLGGMIAQTLAIEYPDLVERLCIGSTTAKLCDASAFLFRQWIYYAGRGDAPSLNDCFFEHVYSPEYRARFKDTFAALRTMGTTDECYRFARIANAARFFDVSRQLHRITCPALSIHSEDDRVFPVTDYPFPQKLYRGFGHAVYDEAPDYREHLLRFLTAE